MELNGKLLTSRNVLLPLSSDDDETLYQSAVEVLGVLIGLVRHVEHAPYLYDQNNWEYNVQD